MTLHRTKGLRKVRKTTVSSAKRKAWRAFSIFIRKQGMDSQGNVQCYTCDKYLFWKDAQCGHWIEGHGNAVYINEDYVRVQCPSCNIFKHGNQGIFRDRIRQELGDTIVDQLLQEAHQTKDLTVSDYEELEKFYSRSNHTH